MYCRNPKTLGGSAVWSDKIDLNYLKLDPTAPGFHYLPMRNGNWGVHNELEHTHTHTHGLTTLSRHRK